MKNMFQKFIILWKLKPRLNLFFGFSQIYSFVDIISFILAFKIFVNIKFSWSSNFRWNFVSLESSFTVDHKLLVISV